MKIVCTQENLNKGLSLVSNIANKSSNLPILNNVLLTCLGKFLSTKGLIALKEKSKINKFLFNMLITQYIFSC